MIIIAVGLFEKNDRVRFVAAQYQYSLIVRDIEREYLDLCMSEGVGLVPWGPLGGGFLSGKYKPDQQPTQTSQGRLATTPDHEEESWNRRNTDQNWQILAVIDEIASKHEATHSQIALAWLLSRTAVASVVLGVRTMEQLEDNLNASDIDLPQDDLSLLDEVSAAPAGYPYRFIDTYGQRQIDS